MIKRIQLLKVVRATLDFFIRNLAGYKIAFILTILFFPSEKTNAAKLYFNDIYKAAGSSYSIQPSSLDNISFIAGSGFKFTSANPADVSFSGNNIAGILSYNNSSNQQVSIYGVVSRQNKANGNTMAVNFMPTDNSYTTVTGEGYILVIPTKESSFSNGNNVGTSSDPIAGVLNDVLATQTSSPIISVNDVTVYNTESYAVFTISLSRAANASTTFTPSLSPVTATLNTDYTNSMQYFNGSSWVSISSTVSIAQGATSLQIRVPILNAGAASNRTFNLNTGVLTGSNVLNSDGAYGIGTIVPPLSAGAIATSQTICVGATPASLTSTTAASGGVGTINYQWETSANNTNWSDVASATSATYSPGAVSVNTYFRRKASTVNDAAVYTSSVLITVQQSVGGSIAGSAAVCAGTNSTVLTLSGYTGSITKWQSSLTSNFASVTDIANTTASLTATNLSATTYYRALVTLGSCTAANSASASITVNPLPSISLHVIPDVTTSATSFTIPFSNLSSGADLYSLTVGTISMTNFVAVSNASITTTPLVVSIPASTQNTYDFNLTVKNSSTGCTAQTSFNLVVSDINPGSVGTDQTICYGTSPATFTNTTDASGGGGSPTYIWQISTAGVSGPYSDISGATSAIYTHLTALTANTYFRRKATIGSSVATSHPIEVLVNALPTVSVTPSSSSITSGSSVSLSASGASTYSWSPSTGLSASNTAVVTATPTATTTYTVTGTNSTTSCSSTASMTITVNPALSAGAISAAQTICVGATPATLTSSTDATGGTGSVVYEWQSSTDGTTFTTISGATSSTYSPGAISVNTYFRRGASTANDASVYSSAILITVQQSVGGSIAGSATVCAGTNSTVLTLSGQTGSITKWQSSLTSNFASATDINNATASLTATNLSATTYYRAVILLGSCSAVNSSSAIVTVTALPSISVTPSSASITSGSSVTLTASGAITYSWSPSTGLSASNTAAVSASPTVTTNYSVTGTSSSCSSTATITVTVTAAVSLDTDGDGVTDAQEIADGTDPNDGCSYVAASKTLTPSTAWNALDCDGDGTPNATDTAPKDPCVYVAGATPVTTNAIWRAADCDGDGVTNGKESDDNTDPNDGCSYVVASKTLTPSTAWNALDCDGDGTPNGTDTDPKDPCVHAVGATPVTTNAIWRAADCDGDGVTNGKEADDNTDPNNGCDYKVASRTLTPTAAWGILDCDADGNPNSTDPNIDRPTASNDVANVPSSGIVTVNILTNDDFLPGANTGIERRASPNDGTAKGTVSFNPLTGEMTYKRAPFESGLVTMGYKVTNNAVNPPVSSFAFVTILACDLADPLSDCDGDGELNGTDLAPTDPCVYEPSRQVKVNVSDDWKALDCDGDGVINGTELLDGTSASDACSFKGTSITLSPSAAWLLLDCDADGVTNQVEGTQDFDGDGIPNCLDTDSDGDSISDKLETTVDTDKDGKPDYLDLDSDNDGILDSVENKACTGTGILCDTDADGIPNFRDLDSDADQISDVIEASGSDYNKDGIADGNIDEKGIPSSANKGLTPPDTDRDGKLDPYDVDSDGDGILDFDEEYNEDADFADCDKDGIINRLDPDECDIFSPQGISPNGDGKNDRLVFKGLFLRKIPNRLSIFNRWGTLVFEMESYDNSFTGTLLPDGTYYYILDFFGKKPTISNYLSVDRTIK